MSGVLAFFVMPLFLIVNAFIIFNFAMYFQGYDVIGIMGYLIQNGPP
jgi:hypothetical protein